MKQLLSRRLPWLLLPILFAPALEAALRSPVHPRRNVEEFAPVEARHVRFVIHATNRGEPCLDELEIYGVDDTRNLALAANGARATSSGSLEGFPIHQLVGINDGLYGNGQSWIAERIEGAWVQIELPQAARIHRVVWSRDRESKFLDRLVTQYEIQVAQDTHHWRTVASSDDREALALGADLSGVPSLARPLVNRFAPVSSTLSPNITEGLSEYRIDVWQTSDGLPGNTVTAIAQTVDGYLWIGTINGLVRFDGVRFKVYDEDLPLPSRRVSCLLAAADGTLWAGMGGGLLSLRDGVFRAWTSESGLPHDTVTGLVEDGNGEVWVATLGGLARWDGARFRTPPGGVAQGTRVSAVLIDERDELWTLVDDQLMRFNEEGWLIRPELGDPSSFTSVFAAAAGASGRVWFGGANSYVGALEEDTVHVYHEQPGQLLGAIWALCETRQGDLWVGTAADGLRRLRDGRFESITTQEGLSDNSVQCLFEDREGSLWVGTVSGGLNRLRARRVTTLTTRDGLAHNVVMSLAEDAEGTLWIASNCGGLSTLRDGVLAPHHASYLLDNECIWSLLATGDGSLWVGTWGGGLFRLRGREVDNFRVEQPSNDTPIVALSERPGGGLWVGVVEGGLRLFEADAFTDHTPRPDMKKVPVTALIQEEGGPLWIATGGAGLVRLDHGQVRTLTRKDGLPGDFVRTLHRDEQGVLWVGTRSGLARIQGQRIDAFTGEQGLPDKVISQIVGDDAGHLWFGSNQGIFRVAKEEFEAVAAGAQKQVNPILLGLADGMESLECTGGFHPAGLRTRDGLLWFSTVKGLVRVDPAHLRVNDLPPPVRLEEVVVDGEEQAAANRMRLESGVQRVEFHYTALSLVQPQRNRFRYRLAGLETDWVEAGTRRVATYPRLAPGRYQFQVLACNNDGVWNASPAVLAVTVVPAFWQTWWFRAALLVAGLGLGAWAVRQASVRRLHRTLSALEEKHGLEQERARIARDIHDELGASLTRITLLSELGRKQRERPDQLAVSLEKISNTARESVRAMDAIVWAVNPRNDSLDHFANYIAQFAEELFRLTSIRCRLDLPTVLPEHALTMDARHQLLMALKESLNNVVRHSGASEVWLRLRCADGWLELVVEDNGRGLPDGEPGSGHDGLVNIRSRLERLGGQCQVQGEPGRGTRLVLRLPLPAGFKP